MTATMHVQPRWQARLPWLLLAVTTALVVTEVVLSIGHEPLSDTIIYGVVALGVAVVGALVATRHPANPIGWIFCGQGVLKGLIEGWGEGFTYHHLPTAAGGAWLNTWVWILDSSAYVLLFLLFPTGRLVSPRWRWTLWLLGASVLIAVPSQSVTSHIATNPLAVESETIDNVFVVGMVLHLGAMAAAVASLVVRYRRSTGPERLQLKHLVLAAAVILPVAVISVPFFLDSLLVQSALGLAFLALPVATGLAILRYRLYDIDVVINRTLVYGALTVTLGVVYLGSVLVLQLVLHSFIEGSSLAIAVSTLAVAALFRPARTRIQHAVDRRFFRSRYDAGQTLERFGSRLRDRVDLADIGTDLIAVVGETVQPSHASLWLRASENKA